MSLQVWLPLTKDLRQQGLSNIKVENHNATLNTAGKLGSCYYFNGSQQWLQFDTVLGDYYNNDWSIACWLKPTDSTRSVIISEYSSTGASNVGLELTTSRVVRLYWNGSPDINFTTAGALPINEWTHLTVTKQARIVKVYFNGELKQTYTNSSDFSTRTSASYPRIGDDYRGNSANTVSYQGYINDFRMYDHCLSPMEVKELAKGLVLHYPLNRQGWGQENLDNFSSVASNWTMESLSGSNYSDSSYGNVIKLVTNAANQRMYHNVISTLWQSGQVYTVSFLAKADQNGRTCDMSRSIADFSPTFTLTTQWKRYSGKITSTATPGGGTLSFRVNQSGATVYITQIKLEKGTIATPYCPSSSEALYTTMGLNSTTEYDCSGFCNNGTRTGTFSWTSDTPKYSVSTAFSGSQYITEDNEIETTDSTIAAWVKTSLSANAFILDCRNSSGAGKQPIYQYTNGSIQSGGASQYVTTNTGLLVANTWIHLAIVQSGSSLLVYKNGSLFQTLSCTNSPIIKPTVGARYSLSGLLPSGNISDVRIYATALSADDVKSLYQNCATIDPDGTIRGQIRS